MIRTFLFHDDIEEILVAAIDPNDAFMVIQEAYGKKAADGLILARLTEVACPPGTAVMGRGILATGRPGTFRR